MSLFELRRRLGWVLFVILVTGLAALTGAAVALISSPAPTRAHL